jgi:aminomethyltransferase
MSAMDQATPLRRTPLYAFHLAQGAKMVPFAGYEMPVQYPPGIMREHLHTRAEAGLFDVSHMGQIALAPRSGRIEDAACALETLVPIDIVGLAQGRQRYGFFTNDAGGILDDLMIANRGDHLHVIVNAACKEADEAHLRRNLSAACTIEVLADRALLAVQGPKAQAALAPIAGGVEHMGFMDIRAVTILGAPCVVSRSGYTGEDGFEISVPAASAQALARALLANGAVAPIGLGARDSLRLEAALCLYGADIDTTTTPVEAAIDWAIQKVRRAGGARAGNFPGAAKILGELAHGAPRRRVGLRSEDRTPVRGGARLYAEDGNAVGTVTSGGFGPSVNAPVAMGMVAAADTAIGTRLFAEVRGKRVPVRVCALPFVAHGYRRQSSRP